MIESRAEYRIEALLVGRDQPESEAKWATWSEHDDLDSQLARGRLAFLADCKERAHSGRGQAQTRVLDYRVFKRIVTYSDWVPMKEFD